MNNSTESDLKNSIEFEPKLVKYFNKFKNLISKNQKEYDLNISESYLCI